MVTGQGLALSVVTVSVAFLLSDARQDQQPSSRAAEQTDTHTRTHSARVAYPDIVRETGRLGAPPLLYTVPTTSDTSLGRVTCVSLGNVRPIKVMTELGYARTCTMFLKNTKVLGSITPFNVTFSVYVANERNDTSCSATSPVIVTERSPKVLVNSTSPSVLEARSVPTVTGPDVALGLMYNGPPTDMAPDSAPHRNAKQSERQQTANKKEKKN